MGFFKDLFSGKRKNSEPNQTKVNLEEKKEELVVESIPDGYTQAGLTCAVSSEERELVSVITSAIIAEQKPDSKFVVKSVVGIDEEKMVAGVVASAILTGSYPDSSFKLKSVIQI